MKILLDTNILLSYPEIVSRSAPDIEFVIIPQVIQELRKSGEHFHGAIDVAEIVNHGINSGNIKLLDPETILSPKLILEVGNDTDALLLNLLEEFDNRKVEAFLASNDGQLTHIARDVGLDGRSATRTLAFLDEKKAITLRDVEQNIIRTKYHSYRYMIGSFIVGVLLTLLANITIHYHEVLLRTFNIWGTITIVPMLGVFFYWLRARFRLSYGFVEFFVGLVSVVQILLPLLKSPAFHQTTLLQIIGGLYIMVRGLDNIGKGIRGTRFQPLWQRAFGE